MIKWIVLFGEVMKLVNTLTDPDERRKSYELMLDKNAKKALEYAEEGYHLTDTFVNALLLKLEDPKKAEILLKIYLRKYNRNRRRFFKHD